MIKVLESVTFFILLSSCNVAQKQADSLLRLSNDTIEIGLLPDVGGALVRVSLVGQANILQSDSTLWNEPAEKRPSLDPNQPFKAYNGHINKSMADYP